jgi:hypothetical protein
MGESPTRRVTIKYKYRAAALLLLVWGITLSLGDAHSEEAGSPWSLIAETQREIFANLPNWHYVCTTEATASKEYAAKIGLKEPVEKSEFSFWSSGPEWRYDINYDDQGVRKLRVRQAYDGSHTQTYQPVDDVLGFSTKELTISDESFGKYGNFLFITYGFLIPPEFIQKSPPPTLSPRDIENSDFWKKLGDRSISIVSREGDKIVISISPPPTAEKTEFSYSYEVTFDGAHNYLPVAFKRFNPDGKLISDASINDFLSYTMPNGKKISLPKQVQREEYDSSGKLMYTAISKVESLDLNEIKDSSEIFTLDPASVKKIHDEDSDTFIDVPQ